MVISNRLHLDRTKATFPVIRIRKVIIKPSTNNPLVRARAIYKYAAINKRLRRLPNLDAKFVTFRRRNEFRKNARTILLRRYFYE